MASAKKPSKSAAKKPAGARTAAQAQDKRKREISGVLLIAAGILAAAYLFFSATGFLGEVLGKALFALIGMSAYALPVILIGVGVLYIRGGANERLSGSGWFVVLGIFMLVAMLQAFRKVPFEDVSYMNYLKEAYLAGQSTHVGGGFIGAALCYPMLLLGGKTLAYVLTIVLLLVCVIVITGLSLTDMTNKVADSVVTAMESTREERSSKPMFTLTLDEETPAPTRGKKQPALGKADEDALILDFETKRRSQGKRKKKQPEMDDGLSFTPLHGELRTKTGEKPLRRKPERVVSDIWDGADPEPGDDVPLIVKRASGKNEHTAPAPLPDPTPLFGAQKTAPESEEKKPPRTVKPKTQPEVIEGAGAIEAYEPPPFSLLNKPGVPKSDDADSPEEKARILIDTLNSFNISAHVTDITVGPALTRIEIQPAPGVRISRITSLTSNITMALSAPRLRMEAPVPGKNAIGIEIPNKRSALVVLRDIVESREFVSSASPVTMAFGKEASGKIIVADLTKMPHMLIAGATGSGKSVCINDIIISIVYKSSPADVKFVLVDPKMVEMTMYGSLPHLLIPVVTEPKKAAGALRWAVNEMTRRYKVFSECNARNLDRFNERAASPAEKMPRIVVIIDELADLMMVAPDDVEDSIRRIAQLGRAAGIHLILATQRPDATVITGLIKANVPSRAAFAVSSATNSRIILDMSGAEKLLGSGDMLFHPDGSAKPTRLQCAFVSDEEVERVVSYFRDKTQKPVFDDAILSDVSTLEKTGAGGAFGEGKQEDDLLGDAVRVVLEHGQASTSMIQRRLRVGYARASRLIDIMEQKGYISGFNGSKARDVIIKRSQYEELFGDGTPLAEPPANGGTEEE